MQQAESKRQQKGKTPFQSASCGAQSGASAQPGECISIENFNILNCLNKYRKSCTSLHLSLLGTLL